MKEQEKAPSPSDRKTLGRRQLLMKVAAAGGAAAAFKLLPERWTKPVVDMVELPVHAQVSLNQILLTNLSFIITPPKSLVHPWGASFAYEDGSCGIDDSASLYSWITPCGEILYSGDTLSAIGATYGGNCNGNISFPFSFNCPGVVLQGTDAKTYTQVQNMHIVLGVGARNSNELIGPIPAID